MTWLITTPDGYTLTTTDDDLSYLESLRQKGYRVELVAAPNVCIACEG